ncbi:hypothetical protein BN7_6546 [Wickerhamomyces ciferrii]|uniref:Uncharacterized protein n=1 Tax=Wickerhamomyces ciferrii (strain ATCC 14091 / BCRC 22168 / CBS 111 / JCM 3599 / NBRC 0793 / NRRL Y-1031 F-60-10) TaxID=1206466 RepID=K0KNT7_WICCF|nr:uncharacterized protein BN7_6546 [Wickerhamomyces ciferrii]CCH46940.1 hypothetical protein BN7_6546 [Wickerhamomyces ciferrii]
MSDIIKDPETGPINVDNVSIKRRRSNFQKIKHTFTALSVIILLGYTIYTHHSSIFKSLSSNNNNDIPPNPYSNVKALRPSTNSEKSHFIYTDPDFRNASLKKYQGWEPFLKLHEFLEKTYPLIHKHLKVEKINKLGLIVTFQGSKPELEPILFTAHQDVVPVDHETLDKWNYPPYSAHFDGKFVWGRGSADTKNLFSGIFETFEELLKDGIQPKRTLIFAGGYDEEAIGRYDGAKSLQKFLENRYGHKSFYALLDEGGGVSKVGENSWIASPGIAEKGYLDIYIQLFTPGGHSSIPPDHTSIGIIGDLTGLIENDPYPSVLTADNPILDFLRTSAEISGDLDDDTKNDYIRAKYDSKARERVLTKLIHNKSKKYLVRTSQSIDIVQAGVKINAIPEVLTLGINHRISLERTAQEVIDNVIKNVKIIAEKHGLGVTLEEGETTILDKTEAGSFDVRWVQALDPSPISKTNDKTWDILSSSIKHSFDDVIFKDQNQTVEIAPYLVGGYTDASRYWPLTDHVYRFAGAASNSGPSNAHAINEHSEFDTHLQIIAFLYDYILNVNEYDS